MERRSRGFGLSGIDQKRGILKGDIVWSKDVDKIHNLSEKSKLRRIWLIVIYLSSFKARMDLFTGIHRQTTRFCRRTINL